jgi:hypothetical protein
MVVNHHDPNLVARVSHVPQASFDLLDDLRPRFVEDLPKENDAGSVIAISVPAAG